MRHIPESFTTKIRFSDLFEQLLTRTSSVLFRHSLPKKTTCPPNTELVRRVPHLQSWKSWDSPGKIFQFQPNWRVAPPYKHKKMLPSTALSACILPFYGVLAAKDVVLCCTLQHRVDHHWEIGPRSHKTTHFCSPSNYSKNRCRALFLGASLLCLPSHPKGPKRTGLWTSLWSSPGLVSLNWWNMLKLCFCIRLSFSKKHYTSTTSFPS